MRTSLALICSLLLAACPGGTTPSTPKPPKVSFSPMPGEVVGTQLSFTVQVTGCVNVKRVWVTDHDRSLAELASGGATNTLSADKTVFQDEYKSSGIPAHLSLFAHATCRWEMDGGVLDLTGDSDEQVTTFMPAQEVDVGAWPFGNNFWVDSDANSLLTCTTDLTRLGRDKKQLGATVSLPFDCGWDAELTFGKDGNRYLMKPGSGVVGFTAGMAKTMQLMDYEPLQILAPTSASDHLIVLGKNGTAFHLWAIKPADGTLAWDAPDDVTGSVGGHIVMNRLGQIVFPSFAQDINNKVTVEVQVYSVQDGRLIDTHPFGSIQTDPLSFTPIPSLTFDATAEVAYLAEIKDPSHVWACDAINSKGCTDIGTGRLWTSPSLAGGVVIATRTANALVAWGDRAAYFLNPTTGAAITSTSAPIIPKGSLSFTAVVGGGDGSTYLFAQPKDADGKITGNIQEIIIFDQPNKRVADFVTQTDGFLVDIDKNGRAWLWRFDMTPLMLPSDYRAVIGP